MRPVSVSQLNNYIKRTLASDPILSNVTVRGEISKLTFHGSGHVYYKIVYSLNNNKAVNTDGSVSYSAGLRYNIYDYEGCYDNFFYLEPVSDSKSSDAYNLITRGTLKSGGICVEVPDNGGSGTVLKTAALNKNAKNQQWTLTQTS